MPPDAVDEDCFKIYLGLVKTELETGMRFRMGGGCGPRGFDFPGSRDGHGPARLGAAGARRLGRLGRRRRAAAAAADVRFGRIAARPPELIADQPRHGYDLIRAVEEMTHGAYAPSPGVVYPTLTMLQDMGLIEEAKARGRAQGLRSHRPRARTISPRRRRRSTPCSSGSRSSAATSARPAARRSSARSAICSPRSGTAPPARTRTKERCTRSPRSSTRRRRRSSG